MFTYLSPILLLAHTVHASLSDGSVNYLANIECSSSNLDLTQCSAPDNVTLCSVSVAKQLSQAACTLNKTFGITVDKKGVWVINGCRAEFAVKGDHPKVFHIHCSSTSVKPEQCRPIGVADVRRVSVERQLSQSACTENVNYGITLDRRGVWASHGCRAVFRAVTAMTCD